MCDFKPGDEVVCVDAFVCEGKQPEVEVGGVYEIVRVYPIPQWMTESRRWVGRGPAPTVAVFVRGHAEGYPAQWFRKVQRRDLSAWLETATDFEEPTRAPVVEPA